MSVNASCPQAAESHPRLPGPAAAERDRFGVPLNLLGQHPDDFFSIIGRVVTLCSLLDERLHTLDARLKPLGAKRADPTLAKVIESCRTHLSLVSDVALRDALHDMLEQADRYRTTRNDAAHSIFPAQLDGSVFWWRQDGNQLRTSAPQPDSPSGTPLQDRYRPTTLHGWRTVVRDLADIVVASDRLTWRLPPHS